MKSDLAPQRVITCPLCGHPLAQGAAEDTASAAAADVTLALGALLLIEKLNDERGTTLEGLGFFIGTGADFGTGLHLASHDRGEAPDNQLLSFWQASSLKIINEYRANDPSAFNEAAASGEGDARARGLVLEGSSAPASSER